MARGYPVGPAAAPSATPQPRPTPVFIFQQGTGIPPGRSEDVWWGDQTWDEMMFTGLTFSIDAPPSAPTAGQ